VQAPVVQPAHLLHALHEAGEELEAGPGVVRTWTPGPARRWRVRSSSRGPPLFVPAAAGGGPARARSAAAPPVSVTRSSRAASAVPAARSRCFGQLPRHSPSRVPRLLEPGIAEPRSPRSRDPPGTRIASLPLEGAARCARVRRREV
jgi:hypothetical protein